MLQIQVNWPLGPRLPERTYPPPRPGHVLPTNKQVIGRGTALRPEGEVGELPFPRWPSCWMTGGLGTLVAPPNEMSISIKAPQVVLDMAGQKINFLTDTRATYSVLICHAGPHASKSCTVTGVNGKPQAHSFPAPLTGQFELWLISPAFPIVPQCLSSILGRGLLGSPGDIFQLGVPKEPLILTLRQTSQKSKILFLAIFYKQ